MTASRAFGVDEKEVTDEQRQAGKTTNFLMIFDGKEKRLQEQLKVAGLELELEECSALRAGFFEAFPGVRAHIDRTLAEVRRRRLVVSEAGRVRRLPDIDYVNYWKGPVGNRKWIGPKEIWRELIRIAESEQCPQKVRHLKTAEERAFALASLRYSRAAKQALNQPVQSLGATITKFAIMNLQKAGYRVVVTVHDSVTIELEEARLNEVPRIKQILESAYRLRVPLKWDVKTIRSLDEKDVYVAPSAAA
jgi:DNA polymerase-1